MAYSDEDREFLESVDGEEGQEDGQASFTVGFRHELGARTELNISAGKARYEYQFTDVETELDLITAGIIRQMGREIDLQISVRHAKQEIDNNRDGKPDEFRTYEDGLLKKGEMDTNFDGKIDKWVTYERGAVISEEIDEDHDGTVDTIITPK